MGTLWRLYIDLFRKFGNRFSYRNCIDIQRRFGKISSDGRCSNCKDKGCPFNGFERKNDEI